MCKMSAKGEGRKGKQIFFNDQKELNWERLERCFPMNDMNMWHATEVMRYISVARHIFSSDLESRYLWIFL